MTLTTITSPPPSSSSNISADSNETHEMNPSHSTLTTTAKARALIKATKLAAGTYKSRPSKKARLTLKEDREFDKRVAVLRNARNREEHGKLTKTKVERTKKLPVRNHELCREEMVPGEPFRFLDLPTEIRNRIYGYCFTRPVPIRPGVTFHRRRLLSRIDVPKRTDTPARRKYTEYSYYWSVIHSPDEEDWDVRLPAFSGGKDTYPSMYWLTVPTPAQWEVIEAALEEERIEQEIKDAAKVARIAANSGVDNEEDQWSQHVRYPRQLDCEIASRPTECEDGSFSNIFCNAAETSPGSFFIHNTQYSAIPGIFVVRLFRTCKQIFKEATSFLYGYNQFDFGLGNFRFEAVREARGFVPSLANGDGSLPSAEENAVALAKLFKYGGYKPKAIWNDGFLEFLSKIGPRNADLLQSIKISGAFKTAYEVSYVPPAEGELGLSELLPIYSTTMNLTCPHMKQVTLDITQDSRKWAYDPRGEPPEIDYRNLSPGEIDRVWEERRRADEEYEENLIFEAVGTLVKSLPALRELRLGAYGAPRLEEHRRASTPEQPYDERWGWAREWVGDVEKRTVYPVSWFYVRKPEVVVVQSADEDGGEESEAGRQAILEYAVEG